MSLRGFRQIRPMKPIAKNTSDFPTLIRDGQIYVDKTRFFHRMVTDRQDKYFFLARPRRFGKTLMLSTLKAIFEGRRDLFAGLDIDKTDYDWKKYPVLSFNFGQVATSSLDEFDATFPDCIKTSFDEAGIGYDPHSRPSTNFRNAILELNARNNGHGVVVLIDEYDDPAAKSLNDIAQAEAVRNRLGDFYAQLKDRTDAVRFLMITGVSKFTKMSVFSTLSNMTDISLKDQYAIMLGYTDEELDVYFDEQMRVQADMMRLDYAEYRRQLKWWYNGFRFTPGCRTTLYNPISIAMTLAEPERQFAATWIETGRPSMLMNYLNRFALVEAMSRRKLASVSEDEFDVSNMNSLKPVGMLFQTGYLTIRDYNPDTRLYTLDVPDEEIRRDVALLLVDAMADRETGWASRLGNHLRAANWPEFFDGLSALYAKMCYGPNEKLVHEYSYARILHVLLASQGLHVAQEETTANGRSDIVAEYAGGVFIFELKKETVAKQPASRQNAAGGGEEQKRGVVTTPSSSDEDIAPRREGGLDGNLAIASKDKCADAAFAQIDERGYAKPYLSSSRPVWAIALVFDSDTRQLVDAQVKAIIP